MKKEKMVKTARTLDKVFKILQVIVIVCAVAAVVILGVFTVINAVNPDALAGTDLGTDLGTDFFYSVDVGPLTLELTEGIAPDSGAVLAYIWSMAAAIVVTIAVGCYILGVIRKILAPMTQGDPFHPSVGKAVRRLAFAWLVMGIIQNVVNTVETLGELRIFNLSALLQSDQIRSVTASFRYDAGFIIVFFVLLLMSYVFSYGEELQRLSDETL